MGMFNSHGPPGVSAAEVAAQIAGATAALPQFVNNGAFQTWQDLFSNFPAGLDYLGKLGRVNNLWGSIRSTMVCEYDGTTYYWRPQRTDYSVQNMATSGAMTWTPLLSAPEIVFPGVFTGNVPVTLSAVNAWPGASARFRVNGVFAILGLNVSGLVGGGTVPILSGGNAEFKYSGGATPGWYRFS